MAFTRAAIMRPVQASMDLGVESAHKAPMKVTITRENQVIWEGNITVGAVDRVMPEAEWRQAMRAEAVDCAIEDGVFDSGEDAADCAFTMTEE